MCKYAVVRYTVYMSREFDEPMDGIVYMMACGTGFAVWVNYHRLSGQGHQVYLSTARRPGGRHHARPRLVRGRARLRHGPREVLAAQRARCAALLLMLGLLGAAALNGQFSVSRTGS